MTSVERISNILKRKPVDRVGLHETFWPETHKAYLEAGKIKQGESFEEHFNLDIKNGWCLNTTADIDFAPVIIEETDETIVKLDGNGAYLRYHKLHASTPEHIKFTVTDRESWEKYKPLLTEIDERRINFEEYRTAKEKARKANQFFTWSGTNVFECMHPICGHENMLVGMALDPEWIMDMAKTYSDLIIATQEILFSKEGKPDGVWYYEDMGFKERPFMSPAMYCELIQPYHKKTIDFNHSLNLPVIMHSCGFIEPLLPFMIEAGINCLQAMEVKAGMDLLRIHKNFGDVISLMGGIDVRCLCANDKNAIDKELESKIPIVKEGFGYILHSDHSIPNTVEYETLEYFFEKGLELGKY